MRVTTFNEETEKLIAQSPKLLQEYIIALKNSAKTWERLTQECLNVSTLNQILNDKTVCCN